MTSQNRKRLLVITYSFPPLGKAGASIRVVKFIKYLSKLGWSISVLAADRSRLGPSNPQPNSAQVLLDEIPVDIAIHRTRAWRIPTNWYRSLSQRLAQSLVANRSRGAKLGTSGVSLSALVFPDADLLWALMSIMTGIRVVRRAKIDVIYAVAPPMSALLIGLFVAALTGKPLVVDYKDDRIDVGEFHTFPGWVQRFHLLLENLIVRRARYVICVTPRSWASFQKRHPRRNPTEFVLIPNGADLHEYAVLDKDRAPHSIQDSSKFIIVNAGGYVPNFRNASTFLQALALIVSRRPCLLDVIRVRFIGEGAFSFYGKILEELGISSILEEIPTMGREDFVAALRSADLLLLIQTLGYPTSVAGTLYEYWAAGTAPIMIVGEPGEMWDLLNAHGLGIAVDHDDVEGIATAIETLIDTKLTGLPRRISQEGIERYDRRRLADQLDVLLRQAIRS